MKNSIQISLRLKYLFGILTLALILTTPAMSSGIYKWTDENGKIHYGSQRPQDTAAEKMKLQIAEPGPYADIPEEDKTADKTAPTVDDKASQERVVYCKNERKRLKIAEINKVVYEKDAT
ncbi:MAG: DUF4124 domain-containing protein, partial [Gammaproteobacteria bacterium]|nr:DUF4124 domain-containing protein [Gammaproteobacteria bacterium]